MPTRQEPTASFLISMKESEVAGLDAWIAEQPSPRPSREAAIALGVCDWLIAMRHLPPDACR
jgi:hypothetical protein